MDSSSFNPFYNQSHQQLNNTTTISSPFCTTYKDTFNFIQDKYSIITIVFGTFGNLMSFMVLCQAKMRIHSTFTYLTALSICDLFVIYFGLFRDYLVLKYNIHIDGTILCKVHVFTFYFLLHMSSWLLVAVNIDRLIASSCLTFSKVWCTPRKALCVILCLAIVIFFINSHILVYVEAAHNDEPDAVPVNPYVYQKCIIKGEYSSYNKFFQKIFSIVDLTVQVCAPFCIMLICNINIIQKVLFTNQKVKGRNLKRLRKIKGMCIMIVSLSIIFFVLELPVLIFICLLQATQITIDSPCIEIFWILTNMMMYTNHCINFFLYCVTGSAFRREFIRVVSIEKLWNLFNLNILNKGHHHNRNVNRYIGQTNATSTKNKFLLLNGKKRQNIENEYATINANYYNSTVEDVKCKNKKKIFLMKNLKSTKIDLQQNSVVLCSNSETDANIGDKYPEQSELSIRL